MAGVFLCLFRWKIQTPRLPYRKQMKDDFLPNRVAKSSPMDHNWDGGPSIDHNPVPWASYNRNESQ
jgi:hypothetical protein